MASRRYEGREDARGVTRVNALAWRAAYDDLLPDDALDALPDPVEMLRLEMREGNAVGRRFYEARGFEPTGTASQSHDVAGESYPTVVYARPV